LKKEPDFAEDGGMGRHKRSGDDIRRTIEKFDNSGLTRREFCQRHDIAVTTLDYWRRAQTRAARLVEVKVAARMPDGGFTLSLRNGRRIETGWRFGEAELTRLIRIAESA
jgi:hypothetical protein